MKKISTLFLSITFAFSLSAYNYQTVYSHRICLFGNENNQINSMRIDSVKFQTDSILYPMKNIQQLDVNCYTPYGASWLGNKIIVKPDWNYFFNENNDTIKIKTDAKLNESWAVYSKGDTKVIATITKIELLSFLGLTDSVKTIRLIGGVTTSGILSQKTKELTTVLDGNTMLLSKHYGFVNTFNFLIFPAKNNSSPYFQGDWENCTLAGMTNPTVGVQNLTWFDVHDFQVGDEIHTNNRSFSYGNSVSNKSIYKYMSRVNYKDSIIYTIEYTGMTESFKYETHFYHYTFTTVIKPYNFFDALPNEPKINYSELSSMSMSSDGNTKIKPPYGSVYNTTCWVEPMVNGCFPNYNYIKGLGGPYYRCEDMFNSNDIELVYSKKGTTTWGTPLVINGIHQPSYPPEDIVFPNPATDRISISPKVLTETFTFELMDLRGIIVLRTTVDASQNDVNINNLTSGLYMYRLMNKGKMVGTGKVVKI
jgi:hypothetical protein